MNYPLRPAYFVCLAAALAAACRLGADWDRRLELRPEGMDLGRAQSSYEGEDDANFAPTSARTESGTWQKVSRAGGKLTARYGFINFNKDRLTVSYGMSETDFRKYMAGYGYTDAEMRALRDWKQKYRTAEWTRAYAAGGNAAAERAIAAADLEYDTKLRGLLRSRGLALRQGNIIESDMPVVVKRNVAALRPLALAIQQVGAQKGYGSEELVGAALSLVQTAIRYKVPPLVEGALHTGGLLPPARALLSGWGDCDTKTGLVASVLSSWSGARLLGVAVPGHYLMALRRLPAKGDMFVRHEGLEYVLVEPAGPAWLEPGQVGAHTVELLNGAEGYQLEPFF